MNRSYRHLLLASSPAALIGVANLGAQIRAAPVDAGASWQLALLAALGLSSESTNVLASFVAGAVFWLPLLVVCVAVSLAWAKLFARTTGRPIDPVWLPAAWLFALMLPASVPLGTAAIALSFGLVFGCHVFGGTDRYLINPALLGIVFLGVGYPALTAPDAALPGGAALATWSSVAATGIEAAQLQGVELLSAMTGEEVGAIGTTSALASLVGVAYLIGVRVAAPSIVAGGLAGSIIACVFGGGLPWVWQLALGNFAFALAFVATDATTRPATRAGRVLYGALFGALVIVLRTANPSHPEGTWAALLLATLCIPLLERTAHAARQVSKVGADA